MSGQEAQRRFVEQFALLLAEAGIPRMAARVFACVLADDAGRLTATELARAAAREPRRRVRRRPVLTQIGLLTRAREPGARRDHYELGDDVWYESFTRRDQLLARWEHRLADGERDLGPDTPAGRRLAETRAFFAFLREEMPAMLERWRERRRELDQS